MKLASIYKQVKEENEKLGKILVPRRSSEEREKNFLVATNKKVQEYIKNGSQGNLNLEGTPITSLPDNLTKIGGYLNLMKTRITSLPENLTVGSSLYLRNTKITSLPNNLTVGGFLDLANTPITSLPDDLTVKGDLFLQRTPISKQYTREQIKQMVPGVKGGIYIH
jgi:hypothetical protein